MPVTMVGNSMCSQQEGLKLLSDLHQQSQNSTDTQRKYFTNCSARWFASRD